MIPNRQMRRHPEMFGLALYAPDGEEDAGGGGAATATLERPAGDVKTDDTTDVDASADGDTDAGTDAADASATDETPKYDAETQALIDAALEQGRVEARTQVETEAETAAQEETRKQRESEIKNLLKLRNTDVLEIALPYRNDDGEEVKVPLKEFAFSQEVLAAMQKRDVDMEEHFGLGFREAQDVNMLALLPEAVRADVQKQLDAATDYKTHAKVFGDAFALHSDALKDASLEELVKLSPKANTEHKALLRDAKREGRLLGQNDPDGEPAIGGNAAPGGEMTYERFLKLKEPEKDKWSAANPEKFAGFLGIKKGK